MASTSKRSLAAKAESGKKAATPRVKEADAKWPEAMAGVLSKQRFLITGTLQTIAKKELVDLIKGCGGIVMYKSPKDPDALKFLIMGKPKRDKNSGQVISTGKLKDAERLGFETITEDDFQEFLKESIKKYDGVEEEKSAKKKKKTTTPRVKSKMQTAASSSKSKSAKKAKVVESSSDREAGKEDNGKAKPSASKAKVARSKRSREDEDLPSPKKIKPNVIETESEADSVDNLHKNLEEDEVTKLAFGKTNSRGRAPSVTKQPFQYESSTDSSHEEPVNVPAQISKPKSK